MITPEILPIPPLKDEDFCSDSIESGAAGTRGTHPLDLDPQILYSDRKSVV